MRHFFMIFPWPLYPAITAWCAGFVIQVMMSKEVDHQKVAQFKMMTVTGHYLKNRLGTEILTERGLKIHRWFLACAGVFIASLMLAAALYARR
jgi:hypothetical protein